jgi:hypothetical protein
MNFVKNVIELYDLLILQKELNKNLKSLSDYMDLINNNLYSSQLKENFISDMNSILETKLTFCKDDLDYARKLKEISWYEDSMAVYSTIIIFWAKYNNAGLTERQLSKLSEAAFIGVIGYKLIDIHNDENMLGKEASIIGNYLIHLYEEILLEIFPYANTINIISKYVCMYTEVEFLEKRNRWKECPFSWEAAERIGWKAAPLFSIFELIFRNAGIDETDIELKIKGLIFASSALQMADDLIDAVEDLSNGIETLVMKGFYKSYGKDKEITAELVDEFLDNEKVLRFYDATQSFYDCARNIYNEKDDILSLFLELQNYRFNQTINS